ncbi:MAG: putative DNA binding domain-containing protein [Firmicutes bacterium]|nr:putative DNA binding domain-containing protein [Bacillota bacterium]
MSFETENKEYKRELSDKLENSVIAFLNTGGGQIHIGVSDDGTVYGIDNIDATVRAFTDRVKNNISPSALGLFSIAVREDAGNKYFIVTIAGGTEKPYFYNKYGRTPKGTFMRVGVQNIPMPQDMIDEMYMRRLPNTLANVISPRQTLTFRQLKIYYEEAGYTIGENFLQNLDFYLPDGKFNYLAYLMADNNGTSIKVARFKGDDPSPVEKDEFGTCCLIKATYSVLNRLDFYNQTAVEFTYPKRIDTRLLDPVALREAALNAIIHNDYINGAYPLFSVYDDRIEILSTGGLPRDLSTEEFFKGRSQPRYRELIRIFANLDLGEQLGSGMKKILKAYNPDNYEISKNFVIAKFPYNEHALALLNEGHEKGHEKGHERFIGLSKNILGLVSADPKISIGKIATTLNETTKAIRHNLDKLKSEGLLIRHGGARGGHWEVVEK